MHLDAKNKKILKTLDENARYPLSVIAKKALLSKQVVDYRIKKLIKSNLIKGFSATIDISRMGYSSYTVYVLLQNTVKDREKEIINFISQHHFTRWLVSCAGEYDLAFTISAKNTNQFNKILKEILTFIGDNLDNYETNTVLDFIDYGMGFLFKNYQKRSVMNEAAKKSEDLDKTDIKILKELQKDARAKLIDIASKLDVSADTVKYRIRSLQKKNIIVAYKPSINYSKLGYDWYQILLHLKNISDPEEKRLMKKLSTIVGIRYIIRCIGKWNFEVHLSVKNNQEFKTLLTKIRNALSEHIKSYDTNIILEKHKSTTIPRGVLEYF